MPRCAKFSAISTPINPPPTTIAFFTLFSEIYFFILSASDNVRSVNIFLLFIPSIFGFIGFAPCAKTNLS